MTWNHPEWGDGVVPDDEGVESDELPSFDGPEMHPVEELPALRVTYRRRQYGEHDTLTVWVNGACAGNFKARLGERKLLDWIVDALEANGATESP